MIRRAMMLLDQGRFDLAEKELRQYLAENMDDPHGHGLLAYCLLRQNKADQALEQVNTAIGLDPDYAFSYFMQAKVMLAKKDYKVAQRAIDQAISLEPDNSSFHAVQAIVHISGDRWEKALAAADEGLRHDPTDEDCLNFRTMALTNLRRFDEVSATAAHALSENPNNEMAHANVGWAALHQGDHKKALEHFSEALHINPNLEWAREGLVEALKARYWIYRVLLQFFLWMSTLPAGVRVGMVAGVYVLMRILLNIEKNHPEMGVFIVPILVLYGIFVLLTWIIKPMFNLLLFFNKFGRHSMTETQRRQGYIFGIFFLIISAGLAGSILADKPMLFLFSVVMAFSAIPACHVFNHNENRLSKRAVAFAVYMLSLAIGSVVAYFMQAREIGLILFCLLMGSLLLYTLSKYVVDLIRSKR